MGSALALRDIALFGCNVVYAGNVVRHIALIKGDKFWNQKHHMNIYL